MSELTTPVGGSLVANALAHLEHLLFVDRPLIPSARERATMANAAAIRAVCDALHRDETIRLGPTHDSSWLASHELDAGAVTAVIRSSARAHGVEARHMLSLREMSEEVITDALRSPRLDRDERDRVVAWTRQLERRNVATDLRRRETDVEPKQPSSQFAAVLGLLFVTMSVSVIVPGSLGVISGVVTSARGLLVVGASSALMLGASVRQVLIAQWRERE